MQLSSTPFAVRRLLTGLVCAAACSFGSRCPAQDAPVPPPSGTATLTVNARLVVIDVVVTGKDGKPVDGLTRNDFKVFEDGKEQPVRSFEPPSAHSLPTPSAGSVAPDFFDPAQPLRFGQSPVTILVLDQLNTRFADSAFAKRELRSFLTRQPAVLPQPTSLLTVYNDTFKQLNGFTRDRDLLLKVLDAAPTKYPWKLEINGKAEYGPLERLDQSLRSLQQIAQNSAGIPGRKNVVWVGGGFPSIDPNLLNTRDTAEVKGTIEHVTNVLLDTRVTLYAVDPTSSAAGMTEITDQTQQAFADAAGDTLSGPNGSYGVNEDFDHLGAATGGRIVRGLNDVAAQVAAVVAQGAQFYTIGYAPTSASEAAGRFRKIKVVCLRPGLDVATRDGYFDESRERKASNEAISYDLSAASETSVPLHGLKVTAEPNHSINAAPGTYVVHVGVSGLTWTRREDGASLANVEVLAVDLSSKGKLLGHTLRGMTATAKAGVNLRDAGRNADFDFTIEPVAKTVALRFIVRDAATGRMGSTDVPVPKH